MAKNFHSTKGNPRIPVAMRGGVQAPMPGGGGQPPMGRPQGPDGRPSQNPQGQAPIPGQNQQGMVRVSPGVYRKPGAGGQAQGWGSSPQGMAQGQPSTPMGGAQMPQAIAQGMGQIQTLPAYLPQGYGNLPWARNQNPAQMAGQSAGQMGMPQSDMQQGSPQGEQAIYNQQQQIRNANQNFGFGEPNAGAMRPQYGRQPMMPRGPAVGIGSLPPQGIYKG